MWSHLQPAAHDFGPHAGVAQLPRLEYGTELVIGRVFRDSLGKRNGEAVTALERRAAAYPADEVDEIVDQLRLNGRADEKAPLRENGTPGRDRSIRSRDQRNAREGAYPPKPPLCFRRRLSLPRPFLPSRG
jgi:hypothetical protein